MNRLNLEQKYEAIQMNENCQNSVTKIAEHFNCGTTQIYSTLKRKTSIKQEYLSSTANNIIAKKHRLSKSAKLKDMTLQWYGVKRAEGLPIPRSILKTKALEIASILNLPPFKASNGWLTRVTELGEIIFQISGDIKTENNVNERVDTPPDVNDSDEGQLHIDDNYVMPETTVKESEDPRSEVLKSFLQIQNYSAQIGDYGLYDAISKLRWTFETNAPIAPLKIEPIVPSSILGQD